MADSQADGARAGRMNKARQKQLKEMEEVKRKIAQEHASAVVKEIGNKFSTGDAFEKLENEFKKSTEGLVLVDDFKKKREEMLMKEACLQESEKLEGLRKLDENDAKRKALKAAAKKVKPKLSFGDEEEEEDQEQQISSPLVKKPKKLGKNPGVDTSFLPDRDREAFEAKEREKLKIEWVAKQEALKSEVLEVTYSYWDGKGNRKSIQITKGHTIGKFLEDVRRDIMDQFRELRATSGESLMYIKEDLIIPHGLTFYDLIVNKARGKSGPLFNFDVHDDVRGVGDVRIEKDESHAGKIVERHWYERNKHIFPASRWEVYDPAIKWEKYTIHGGEVN